MHDITKLVDDISLDDLLEGRHVEPPSLGKEKGRKPPHVNDNVLGTVRKAFAILQREVPTSHVKQYDEIDSDHNILPSSSTSNIHHFTSSVGAEEENSLASDLSTHRKELGDKTEAAPGETKEFEQLYQPKDILERLALPPTEDLDVLLQDAKGAGESSSSKVNDPLKVAASEQVCLPYFAWSHNHNGHNNKSIPDSAKVSRRSSCHGKWLRMEWKASGVHGWTSGADCYSQCLESLTFNQSLVPSGSIKYILPETRNGSSKSVSSPSKSKPASPSITASKDPGSPPAPTSPGGLRAAQHLFYMANDSVEDPIPGGTMKWPKPPSGKSLKALKSKSIASPERLPSTAKSIMMPNGSQPRCHISKKAKLEAVNGERSFAPSYGRNGHFSSPRPSKTSPIRSDRHQHPPPTESNHSKRLTSTNFSKQQQLVSVPLPPVPPPPRFLDTKSSSSSSSSHRQQKPRKIGQIEWNRGRS